MSRRKKNATARRAGLVAVALALGGAIAAVGARIRARAQSAGQQTHTCRCGAVYRVSGADRHRVYWPADAPAGDPVLGDSCPNCGADLPAEHANAVTVQPA